MNHSSTFFRFLLLLLIILSNGISQNQILNSGEAFYINIFYNMKPDSVLINDSLLTITKSGTLFKANTGEEYTIEAFLHGYYTINKKVKIDKKRINPVGLKFKRPRTKEEKTLFWYFVSDAVVFPAAINYANLNATTHRYYRPMILTGLVEHLVWQFAQLKYFSELGLYDRSVFKDEKYSVTFSYTSLSETQISDSTKLEPFYYWKKIWAHFKPGFAFSFDFARLMYSKFLIDFSFQYYPSAMLTTGVKTEIDRKKHLRFIDYSNEIVQNKKYYTSSINLSWNFYQILSQKWFVTIGGYYSPSITFSETYTYKKYYDLVGFPPNTETESMTINYSYSFRGFTTGILVNSLLSSSISCHFRIKYYFNGNISLNNALQEKVLFNIMAGIKYNF